MLKWFEIFFFSVSYIKGILNVQYLYFLIFPMNRTVMGNFCVKADVGKGNRGLCLFLWINRNYFGYEGALLFIAFACRDVEQLQDRKGF